MVRKWSRVQFPVPAPFGRQKFLVLVLNLRLKNQDLPMDTALLKQQIWVILTKNFSNGSKR